MKKIAACIAAVAISLVTSASGFAQSNETQSTDDILRRLQAAEASNAALAKENAALRERLRLSQQGGGARGRFGDARTARAKTARQGSPSDPNVTPTLYDAAAATALASAVPPMPPPPYRWTGFYVGGTLGYSWGRARTDNTGSATTTLFPGTPDAYTNAPYTFAESHTQSLSGLVGGGQVGYNYQIAPKWVLGLEADLQGSGERGSATSTASFAGTFCVGTAGVSPASCISTIPISGTAVTNAEAKIEWFGTLRGRVGALINDEVLLYGTAGLAYGEVDLSGNLTVGTSGLAVFGPATVPFNHARMTAGYVAGGGLEGRFSYWLPPSWTWRLEYLYVDLGTVQASTGFAPVIPGRADISPLAGSVTSRTRFTDNIVRAGLSYQFQ